MGGREEVDVGDKKLESFAEKKGEWKSLSNVPV